MKTNALKLIVAALALASPSLAPAADTIKNNTNLTMKFYAGHWDSKTGDRNWKLFTLAPRKSYTWNTPGRPVGLKFDVTVGDGQFVGGRGTLPMQSRGVLFAFVRYGNRVMIDGSGTAR